MRSRRRSWTGSCGDSAGGALTWPVAREMTDASTPPAELACAIAGAVRDRGGRALLVGGCVRDEILGRAPKDLDLEVFGIPASDLHGLLHQFGRVDLVGESFAVYKVGGLDVALPRRESKSGRGHKGCLLYTS